ADHHERGQQHVRETLSASIEDEQTQELGSIAVPVYDGIEEAAETGDFISRASHAAVHQVKESRSNDHQPSIEKHPSLGLGGRITKEKRANDFNHHPHPSHHMGMNPRQRN